MQKFTALLLCVLMLVFRLSIPALAEESGSVEKFEVAVEITGYSMTYDGKEHTASAVLSGDIPSGYSYEITLTNDALTDVGTGTAEVQHTISP